MQVIKRDCSETEFDKDKIKNAILKAMKNGSGIVKPNIAEEIANEIFEELKNKDEIEISEIESKVYDKLITKHQRLTAKAYEGYRAIREFQKETINTIDNDIAELLDDQSEYWKAENANKNPMLNTTKRDYMAGIVSTDATRRYLLPAEIVQAHDEGILHFHDADYFAQHMHNCFKRDTKFITSIGTKSFEDFNEGETIFVLSTDGKYHKAIVKKYGKQPLFKYTFTNGAHTIKEVVATENHRWLLLHNKETTNLSIGDKLVKAPVIYQQDIEWSTLSPELKQMWIKGFACGDGSVQYQAQGVKSHATRIRLCGEKDKQYLERFLDGGCTLSTQILDNDDKIVYVQNYEKEIPEFNTIEEIKLFFNGLYCADGKMAINNSHKRIYRIQSSKLEIINAIRTYAEVCGLYITKENNLTGEQTNFTSESGRKYTVLFSFNPDPSYSYICKDKEYIGEEEVWCLNVEDTHNFILSGGIPTGNCDLVNLEDMLQNGTVISDVLIEKPHSFSTACTVTTQIIAQIASNQYGGQSISLTHLAPFVDISRQKIRKEIEYEMAISGGSLEQLEYITERRVKKEITKGIQTIQYQLTTLMTTNGQAPFITIFMYLNEAKTEQEKHDLALLIEEMLKQRTEGVKNEDGVFIAPAFPKLIYVLEEDNIDETSKYWYLTELAAECSAKRLVPDYISEKVMLELKHDVYTCMGCRSFLTPDRFTEKGVGNIANAKNYEEGKHKYYGRFNQGVVTLNLVDIALSSEKDIDKFWALFEERTELCHKALRLRHERLKGTPSDVSPILWQHGALARLKKGEVIDKLLYDGYSTISLGYAGLYECVKYMTDKSHSDEGIGEAFGLKVMQALNDKCAQWKTQENIDYSLYGTPLESTTYKFAKKLQERFGVIEGITDRNYITNSYHIPVFEPIDAFEKLRIESKFQQLSPGGAISYIETPSMVHNVSALIKVIQYIYNNIMYAEINTKSCYCTKCGYDGEIPLIDKNNTLLWRCPSCGNEDASTMDIAFRVCGYIGTAKNGGNQGRYGDVHDRVYHLDDMIYKGCDC